MFHITGSGACFLSKSKPSRSIEKNVVLLKKTYWTHQEHKDFKRRCFEAYDHRGLRPPLPLVRYEFDGEPHPICTKPHGNSRKGEKSYHRTKPSNMATIMEKVHGRKGPFQVFKEAGGMMAFASHGDLPRNRQQVSDVKRSHKPRRDKDQMCELIRMSRLKASDSVPFIRRIQVSPEPAFIVSSERQLNDLLRFCTTQFVAPEALCIDTTFNVGNFYVTPTTYKHGLLIDRDYGRPPTMLGPTMIHMQRKRETYQYFGSSLVSLKGDLSNVQAIGADRDIALLLCCKGHVEQDIRKKMTTLSIDPAYQRLFVDDIFGSSPAEFDSLLESFYPLWTKREMDKATVW